MAGRFTLPVVQVADSNGNPGAGDTLTFYASGTTTPLDTYSDDALSVANTNPVAADAAGRFPDIFLQDQDYKVVWKTAAGVTVDTADPVRAAEPNSTAVISKTTTYTVTAADNGKLIKADATAGAFTITLPATATAGDGFEVSVKKVDSSANAVTLDADGSETIDGDTDVSLPNQFDVVKVRSDGTSWQVLIQPLNVQTIALPRGYIDGFILSNNGTDANNDIDVGVGTARDDANGANIVLSASITKRLDASWAVGDGNGGLDAGSKAADTFYFVFAIRRSDTGVVDILFSTSAASPTLPAGYDQKRRIGAIRTDGTPNILPFTQYGENLRLNTAELDHDDTNPGTSAVTVTLDYVPAVNGVQAHIFGQAENSGSQQALLITAMSDADQGPVATTGFGQSAGSASSGGLFSEIYVPVNDSAQIRARVLSSSATADVRIWVRGWIDPRGRDA